MRSLSPITMSVSQMDDSWLPRELLLLTQALCEQRAEDYTSVSTRLLGHASLSGRPGHLFGPAVSQNAEL